MARGWIWLQLSVAWLPIWALFAAIIVIVHGSAMGPAAIGASRIVGPGALLGIAVYRFASRTPWPHPFRLSFVAVHVLAAALYAVSWYALICVIDSLVLRRVVINAGPGHGLFLITLTWLYIVVGGVAYANLAAQRGAKMEAQASRMQLDALRSQLHPHFLFNALHTVVQLIPTNPRAATHAAEQLAGALRQTIEDPRDVISVAEEWAFVQRYLAIENIRFGDRLVVREVMDAEALSALLPSFALQTLVENAVRHAATPRIETTLVTILASIDSGMLTLVVSDDGGGANLAEVGRGTGTGLRRLRERMRWLYGEGARLDLASGIGGGFTATMMVPQLGDAHD